MDEPYRILLSRLTGAKWWIDNRDRLDAALAALTPLPAMAGGTERTRRKATRIRDKLVGTRWGHRIPPGVKAALDRLTDAEWWVRNEVGDGRPMAIDRALGAEVPEYDRKMMALPKYGPPQPSHAGPCEKQPGYAAARKAAEDVASQYGDLRAGKEGSLGGLGGSCCGRAGFRDGEKEGKQRWVDRRAGEIRRATRSTTPAQAVSEARSDLSRLERNLSGWG
ncbi:hypothetical protein [Streptomyces sp. NPDC048419]|uniref:hypothetical protein n=1 Tax=Streptomyces sp. NPDC048419 TaxID=3365547 RepID=UPI0037140819